VGVAGDHREQARFANAGAGKYAEPLAAAAGEKGVERAHAEVDLATDAAAGVRRRRCRARRAEVRPAWQGPAPVGGVAEAVDNAANPTVADGEAARAGAKLDARARMDAIGRGERLDERAPTLKANDLALDHATVIADEAAAVVKPGEPGEPFHLDAEADDAAHPTVNREGWQRVKGEGSGSGGAHDGTPKGLRARRGGKRVGFEDLIGGKRWTGRLGTRIRCIYSHFAIFRLRRHQMGTIMDRIDIEIAVL
jgi:hypothetical protein